MFISKGFATFLCRNVIKKGIHSCHLLLCFFSIFSYKEAFQTRRSKRLWQEWNKHYNKIMKLQEETEMEQAEDSRKKPEDMRFIVRSCEVWSPLESCLNLHLQPKQHQNTALQLWMNTQDDWVQIYKYRFFLKLNILQLWVKYRINRDLCGCIFSAVLVFLEKANRPFFYLLKEVKWWLLTAVPQNNFRFLLHVSNFSCCPQKLEGIWVLISK